MTHIFMPISTFTRSVFMKNVLINCSENYSFATATRARSTSQKWDVLVAFKMRSSTPFCMCTLYNNKNSRRIISIYKKMGYKRKGVHVLPNEIDKAAIRNSRYLQKLDALI